MKSRVQNATIFNRALSIQVLSLISLISRDRGVTFMGKGALRLPRKIESAGDTTTVKPVLSGHPALSGHKPQ